MTRRRSEPLSSDRPTDVAIQIVGSLYLEMTGTANVTNQANVLNFRRQQILESPGPAVFLECLTGSPPERPIRSRIVCVDVRTAAPYSQARCWAWTRKPPPARKDERRLVWHCPRRRSCKGHR